MKPTLPWAILLLTSVFARGQITLTPTVARANYPNCIISKIEVTNRDTYVDLVYEKTKSNLTQSWIRISSSTIIRDRRTGIKYSILGVGDGDGNILNFNTQYSTTSKKGAKYYLTLIFPPLPPGTNSIDIIENNGFRWEGIDINNPEKTGITTNWSEVELKNDWEKNGIDAIEGFYENTNSKEKKYQLALKKNDEKYHLIYLSGSDNDKWKIGDVKAVLTKTASSNIYKVVWYMSDKSQNESLYITLESGLMKILWTDGQPESLYLKLYPTTDSVNIASRTRSSGTGFAISSDGYIVTNQHVINGSSIIKVRGIKGNFSKSYTAELVIMDKNNDLAIIKITDPEFTDINNLPYTINNEISDVGSSVYALGYPLLATMGDEVKLTNGIISSKTGFQGDITTYQISVPVQPGNSGGPLFDAKGNIIGIINAKHVGAENVSYAIKTSYLTNLIQSMNSTPTLPKTNTISTKSFPEQVKFVKEYVYIVEIN